MPHRNWQLRISDIIGAIENVLDYIEGMTFEQFVADQKTIDAVVRNFIIICKMHIPSLKITLQKIRSELPALDNK